MGVSLYVCPSAVFCHAHPNALNATGALKFTAPLQSFWAISTSRTTNIFLLALSNTMPFLNSWGAFRNVDAVSCAIVLPRGSCAHIDASRSASPTCENALGR